MNILDTINGFKSGSIYATPAAEPCSAIRTALTTANAMIVSFTGSVDINGILTVSNLTNGPIIKGQILYGTGTYQTTKQVPITPATVPPTYTNTFVTVNDYPEIADNVLVVSQLTSTEPFTLDAQGQATTIRPMGLRGTYQLSGWTGYKIYTGDTSGSQIIPGPMQTKIPPNVTATILAAITDTTGTTPTSGWETQMNDYVKATSNYMPFINAANNVSSKITSLSGGTPSASGSTDLQTISAPATVVPTQLNNILAAINQYIVLSDDATTVLPAFNTAKPIIDNSFSAATTAKGNVISTITTFATASFAMAKQTPAVQGFMNKILKL
jgi:hypothetical protein